MGLFYLWNSSEKRFGQKHIWCNFLTADKNFGSELINMDAFIHEFKSAVYDRLKFSLH